MQHYYLAIDIGGTQLRASLFPTDSTQAITTKKIATKAQSNQPIDRLIKLIESIWPYNGGIKKIGVAIPGPVDPFRGIVFVAPNIPGWENLALQKILQDRFKTPVVVGNDANLAALGEWKYGAGRGHNHLIYITVSTGIGGGIIEDGRLLLGKRGLAAEIGHITVDPNGPLCGCGQRGHLEAIASGTAIARWVTEQIEADTEICRNSSLAKLPVISARDVSEAAAKHDTLALAALERAGTFMGIGIADFLHLFNPSTVIIGGGVSHSGSPFFDPMYRALRNHVISPGYLEDLSIVQAALGDNAGLLGALALAAD
jgi:glucokinase